VPSGRTNNIVAASLFLLTLAVYLMTVAPTLSFWDCGEFITCSYIMGIPHPPGSPFLALMGRIMSLIPFYDFRGEGTHEIAYRVNMIDVLLGALTVMLTYLIMVKVIRKFRSPSGKRLEGAVVMFSAAMTALMVAFSDEFWNNAVETETYMPSLFMQMTALWLALRWEERKDDPSAIRYIFLAAYILGLGNGVHLMVLLIAPTIALIVFFAKPEWFRDTRLWMSLAAVGAVAALIKLFAGLGIQYMLMALFALASPPVLYALYRRRNQTWMMTLIGIVLCGSLYIIGFSVYPTVMVRAGKSPAINEGNPDNWTRYKLYMEREQYGQENMYIGMFTRKAGFRYQFGYMYLRYLLQQFPIWGPTVTVQFENDRSPDTTERVRIVHDVRLSVLLLSILMYGLYTHVREDRKTFLTVFLFFLASSVGLVLYLNMENPQVRERPYFFLGSYQIIMVWIGTGVWGIVTDLREWLAEKNKASLAAPATVLLFAAFGTLAPASVLSRHIDPNYTNYEVHDRTHDWMPWDYAHNILVSCEKNAILFTNGDNDTFPLWYLQEVKGFRRDVRIVNLSLLNTDWYILQLKRETPPPPPGDYGEDVVLTALPIPIKYSDEFIEKDLCGRDAPSLERRVWPLEGKEITAAGITWTLPNYHRIPLPSGETIGMIRIQDEMVANIIHWVNWTRPIYFAVTVANENKIGLDDHLMMEGMVYRLVKEKAEPGEMLVNVPVMHENVFEKYLYRSLDDPSVYKPPNTVKLVTNYFIGFAQLCERYAQKGDAENAVRAAWAAIRKTPNDFNKRLLLYQAFLANRMKEPLEEFIEWESSTSEFRDDVGNRINLYRLLAAGRMHEKLRELLDREVAAPGFMDGVYTTVDDRIRIYALLSLVGEKERADSLVTVEQARSKKKVSDIDVRLQFGMLLLQNNLDEQAAAVFRDVTADFPDNIQAWKAYTAALYGTGDYGGALEAVNRILELDPADKSARETRSLLLEQLKERTGKDSTEKRTTP